MGELVAYVRYLREHRLHELAQKNLAIVNEMDLPLMRLFAHLSKEELLMMTQKSLGEFLTGLEVGNALELAEASNKQWEANEIPEIPQSSVQPIDLVLIYAAQKQALLDFVPEYTTSSQMAVDIIQELGVFYMKVETMAFKSLFNIQKKTESALRESEEKLREMSNSLEIRVRQRTLELERSNQELERFSYITSHDLQEPLRKIKNFTELLAQRYEGQLDEKGQKYIGYIVDGSTRMQQLITDILTYSRLGRSDYSFAPISLTQVVEQVIANLQLKIQEHQAHITYDGLPTIVGNGVLLSQLLQNLIDNALKFHGAEPPQIHISAQREGDSWLVAVQDNGIGFEPQFADRIFLMFQRLHSRDEYPGTGIGLAICKKVMDFHGGQISVKAVPGQGCTFNFAIPDHHPEPLTA